MTGSGEAQHTNEPMAPDQYVGRMRSRKLVGLLALALLALGACEGDNLFSGDNTLAQPRAAVVGPDFITAGDTFQIRVDGFAPRGIARLDVSLRGAINRDTTVTVTATGNSVSEVLKFAAPKFFSDTLLVVSARVVDKGGFTSSIKSDTIGAFGPPGVVSITKPDSVRAGTIANLRVRVVGSRRITRLDISVRGAMTLDSSIAVIPPRFDVTQDIALQLPATATDTLLRVSVTARDEAGQSGPPLTVAVPLSIDPPTATLTAPPSASPGGNLLLSVRATAMRQVASIRLELRGAVNRDTTIAINPPQSSVTRDVSILLPGDITDPTLTVRAFAIDRAGVVSSAAVATSTATVNIPLGAPVIVSLTSADSTRGGRTFDVRVVARGIRPLTRIDVKFRGAVDQEFSFPVTPNRNEVTQDAQVSIPLVVNDTLITVTATAVDVSGAVSPLSSRTARVRDVTAPNVTASVNPGQASAGRTVSVRVTASDNVGVTRFGFAAVTNAGDTIGITPTLANTRGLSRDSVFTFVIPANVTPTQLRIIGLAFDNSGLRGTSSSSTLTVVDSTFPTVQITDPVDNSSFPLSGQVLVRARVADASGIKRVTFKGIAIRRDSASDSRVVDRFQQLVVTFPQPPAVGLPRDTTLVRFLQPIAGDNTSEIVNIVVLAEDSLGNISSDTNRVTVGGPSVSLVNPVNGSQVQINGSFQITAEASDPQVGLDSMKVYLTGVITDSIVVRNLNGVTTRRIDQPYTVGATTGVVNIVARAWNRQRIQGASQSVAITITSTSTADTQAPQLSLTLNVPERAEVDDDTIRVTVRAQDLGSSGVARIGIVVVAIPDSLDLGVTPNIRRDTVYVDATLVPPRAGGIEQTFAVSLDDFLAEEVVGSPPRYGENSRLRFPRRFTLEVHAFAIDQSGNCGAAVTATTQSLTCVPSLTPPAPTPNTFRLAQNATGLSTTVVAVLGSSVRLPSGGTIADAVVDPRGTTDPARRKLYLSNITNNRLEILDIAARTFDTGAGSFGLVGAAPWGLSFNANATLGGPTSLDTLIVANSGGTNLSFVPVDAASPSRGLEDTGRRLITPNTVLYDVTLGVSNARDRYTSRFYDFSDRPQFIGVNRENIVLYSTVPTGSAPDGTIRFVDTNPNPGGAAADNRPEVKLLFNTTAIVSSPGTTALANIDSLKIYSGGTTDDLVELFDHLPGREGVTTGCSGPPAPAPAGARCIRSGPTSIQNAILTLRALGSDVRDFAGAWSPDRVGLSDTTFVAVSDDRNTVGFGEGATATTGRIMLCCTRNYPVGGAPPPEGLVLGVSQEIAVSDLINNASERVLGLGLNNNGSLGVARGSQAAYFFTRDLRLQGQFSNGIANGGGGAALHPEHASVTTSDPVRTLAFIPTGNKTIKIVNTVHFFQSGEIPIRDNVVGPLRAVRPFASDNTGLAATDPNFVFVKLVGVTSSSQVVIINVRRKDVGL